MGAGGNGEVAAAAWRGLVAAMALSGMRQFTRGVGLVERPPPDEIAEEGMPGLFGAVPAPYRGAAIELAHWGYGTAMGVLYAEVPRALRGSRWFGAGYGLAIWAAYEAGIAPLLGIRHRRKPGVVERLTIAADHVLYGVVVAHRPFDPTA